MLEKEFVVGISPCCGGNGLLLVVKDDEKYYVSCDECSAEFANPKDAIKDISMNTVTGNNVSVTLEEALAQGWAEYIYILEKPGKWVKFTDNTKVLF